MELPLARIGVIHLVDAQNSPNKNIFTYQGVINVSFAERFAYAPNE